MVEMPRCQGRKEGVEGVGIAAEGREKIVVGKKEREFTEESRKKALSALRSFSEVPRLSRGEIEEVSVKLRGSAGVDFDDLGEIEAFALAYPRKPEPPQGQGRDIHRPPRTQRRLGLQTRQRLSDQNVAEAVMVRSIFLFAKDAEKAARRAGAGGFTASQARRQRQRGIYPDPTGFRPSQEGKKFVIGRKRLE